MSACSSRFCSIKSHLLFSHILETAYAFAFRWKLENQQQGWGKLCASSGTWGLQRGLKEVFPSGLWPLCCRKGNSECNMCKIWCGYSPPSLSCEFLTVPNRESDFSNERKCLQVLISWWKYYNEALRLWWDIFGILEDMGHYLAFS